MPLKQAEFQGLEEIQKTNTIHVPKPICIIAYSMIDQLMNYESNQRITFMDYLSFYIAQRKEYAHCFENEFVQLSQYELGRYVAKMHKSLSDNGLYGYYNVWSH